MSVSTIIKAETSKDFIKLQESANKTLSEKVLKKMEEKKQTIAKSYFGKK
jgi:hypothetical protein